MLVNSVLGDTTDNRLDNTFISDFISELSKSLKGLPGMDSDILELRKIEEQLNCPLEILIAGEFKAGKSTFINALLGKKVLKSDVLPATAVITKIKYGPNVKVCAFSNLGDFTELQIESLHNLTAEGDSRYKSLRSNLSHVEVELPIEWLKEVTLIDSPGFNSQYEEHTKTVKRDLISADIVFWIFHANNIGTSTEIDQLSLLRETQIPVIGIVNAIDRLVLDDEDETLEQIVNDNFLRFSSYLKEMVGVSSLEALEGKLINDHELIHFSEWNKIDLIIKKLTENQKVKNSILIQRLFAISERVQKKLSSNFTELKGIYTFNSIEHYIYKIDQFRKRHKEVQQQFIELKEYNQRKIKKIESLLLEEIYYHKYWIEIRELGDNLNYTKRLNRKVDMLKKNEEIINQDYLSISEAISRWRGRELTINMLNGYFQISSIPLALEKKRLNNMLFEFNKRKKEVVEFQNTLDLEIKDHFITVFNVYKEGQMKKAKNISERKNSVNKEAMTFINKTVRVEPLSNLVNTISSMELIVKYNEKFSTYANCVKNEINTLELPFLVPSFGKDLRDQGYINRVKMVMQALNNTEFDVIDEGALSNRLEIKHQDILLTYPVTENKHDILDYHPKTARILKSTFATGALSVALLILLIIQLST
ncbi:dynamin family protein [Bhargavaea massiliensis]|uniref:dynamin family protein n=1 Tax=Bhargavaea massiliensis TaxID=2697500 RepID=UPI001BCFE643|nr:dynamin family protein [Bhargavaea massiliensis]